MARTTPNIMPAINDATLSKNNRTKLTNRYWKLRFTKFYIKSNWKYFFVKLGPI